MRFHLPLYWQRTVSAVSPIGTGVGHLNSSHIESAHSSSPPLGKNRSWQVVMAMRSHSFYGSHPGGGLLCISLSFKAVRRSGILDFRTSTARELFWNRLPKTFALVGQNANFQLGIATGTWITRSGRSWFGCVL